jgi:hypothetical protein
MLRTVRNTHTLCEQNAEFVNVKAGGVYSYRGVSKG